MDNIFLVIHVITALGIIGLILLQQGKGAEMGASFGSGASQTVFGSQGSGNFFSRATAVLATIFFVTSFSLAIVAKRDAGGNIEAGIPIVSEDQADIPAMVEQSDLPQVDSTELPQAGDSQQ